MHSSDHCDSESQSGLTLSIGSNRPMPLIEPNFRIWAEVCKAEGVGAIWVR
jgi:hypothetical protein